MPVLGHPCAVDEHARALAIGETRLFNREVTTGEFYVQGDAVGFFKFQMDALQGLQHFDRNQLVRG